MGTGYDLVILALFKKISRITDHKKENRLTLPPYAAVEPDIKCETGPVAAHKFETFGGKSIWLNLISELLIQII